MPEGPSLVLLKEALHPFESKKILDAGGTSSIDHSLLVNQKAKFATWGKHLLVCIPHFTVRIHLLLFGAYSLYEQTKPAAKCRLWLRFAAGTVFFYSCSVKLLEGEADDLYDWEADVMNPRWNTRKAIQKLKNEKQTLACDALLNQQIFAGVGNIIKNEVLYRIRVHPQSFAASLPAPVLKELAIEARLYSFEFLEWKSNNELKQHWLAHTKKICLRCNLPIIKTYCGKTNRRTYHCENCQRLYT